MLNYFSLRSLTFITLFFAKVILLIIVGAILGAIHHVCLKKQPKTFYRMYLYELPTINGFYPQLFHLKKESDPSSEVLWVFEYDNVKCDNHESVYRDVIMKTTNEIQLYRLIYCSQSALHVSGDDFSHHQEHLIAFTASGNMHQCRCWLVSWMIWN
jgi:hypothetical protein